MVGKELSRREFLKIGAATAAALLFKPDTVHAYDNKEFLSSHEVFQGDTSRNVVLMTYDDFNSRDNINLILDAYKEHNYKTSFFFPAGYDRRYLTLGNYKKEVERIVDEGHVFGCHGLVHDPYTTVDSSQVRSDIEKWLGIVKDIIPGYEVKWLRFPFGDRDERTKKIFAEYGMQSVMWSLESGGEDEETYKRVTSKVQKGDIVLNHTHRYYDAHDVSRILDFLQSENFSVESVETGLKAEDYSETNSINYRKRIISENR